MKTYPEELLKLALEKVCLVHLLIFATSFEFRKLKNLVLWSDIWMLLNKLFFQACFSVFDRGNFKHVVKRLRMFKLFLFKIN